MENILAEISARSHIRRDTGLFTGLRVSGFVLANPEKQQSLTRPSARMRGRPRFSPEPAAAAPPSFPVFVARLLRSPCTGEVQLEKSIEVTHSWMRISELVGTQTIEST